MILLLLGGFLAGFITCFVIWFCNFHTSGSVIFDPGKGNEGTVAIVLDKSPDELMSKQTITLRIQKSQ